MTLHQGLRTHNRAASTGFTLVELIMAVAVLGIVGAISVPMYQDYKARADSQLAAADIVNIQNRLALFASGQRPWRFPSSLAEIGAVPLDPWGNAYLYQNIENDNPNNGALRKDKNLVPINTDYDLYSAGPDGQTKKPLTAKHSRDDIVRANNGKFIGIAEDY